MTIDSIDQIGRLLVIAAGLFIVALAVFIWAIISYRNHKRQERLEESLTASSPPKESEEKNQNNTATEDAPPPSSTVDVGDEPTVAICELVRHGNMGKLGIRVGDSIYQHSTDIPGEKQRRAVVLALKELESMIDKDGLPAVLQVQDGGLSSLEPMLSADPYVDSVPAQPATTKTRDWKERLGRTLAGESSDEPEDLVMHTLADDLELLLQRKLKERPEFVIRDLHFRTSSSGGVDFEMDGARFDDLDAIPDSEVASFMRGIVDHWNEH
ncbi:MAG: hypothetical protein ABFQ89_01845 [Chloroflexota bacterium]